MTKNLSNKTVEELLKGYGIFNSEDIDTIGYKFIIVIAAHKYAGYEGNSPLCRLNELLHEVTSTLDMVNGIKDCKQENPYIK